MGPPGVENLFLIIFVQEFTSSLAGYSLTQGASKHQCQKTEISDAKFYVAIVKTMDSSIGETFGPGL